MDSIWSKLADLDLSLEKAAVVRPSGAPLTALALTLVAEVLTPRLVRVDSLERAFGRHGLLSIYLFWKDFFFCVISFDRDPLLFLNLFALASAPFNSLCFVDGCFGVVVHFYSFYGLDSS